jgi:hypothetical protein
MNLRLTSRSSALIFLLALPATAAAADEPDLKAIKVVVPSAAGQAHWGVRSMTKAMRAALAESVTIIEEEPLVAAMQAARMTPADAWKPVNTALACRTIGADYVLRVQVSKTGWLYTAQAFLVGCKTSDVQMDFRSGYYKPDVEAEDRGARIGQKTVEKLKILLRGGGPAKPPLFAMTSTAATATIAAAPKNDDTVLVSNSPNITSSEEFTSSVTDVSEFLGDSSEVEGIGEQSWSWSVRGWIGTSYQRFLRRDLTVGRERNFAKLGIRTTLTGNLGEHVRIRVLPLLEADATDQRLHRAVIEEGFVELAMHPLELRIGWDSLTWGSASTLNIVDVINARNFSEGLIDAPKIGSPMVAARILFDNHSISFLYLSPFIEPQLPRLDSAFNPFPMLTFQPQVVLGSTHDEWQPQAAVRLDLAFDKVDLHAGYFYGYDRFPMLYLPSAGLFFPLIHHVSADGQILFGQTAIKAELASVWHPETDRSKSPTFALPPMFPMGTPPPPVPLPDQRFLWVAGVEHTFEDVINGYTIIPVAEFIGTSDSEWFTDTPPPDDLTQFLTNHLIYGVKWNLENAVDSKLTLVDLMDLAHPSDHVITVEYSERWFKHFTFALGGVWALAKDGNKMQAFESLSSVFTRIRLNY